VMTLSRSVTIARATVVALLTAGLGARAAGADVQIKAGKWEFTVQVPGVTKLPPGLAQVPGVHVGPGGMTISHTECTRVDSPLPRMARGPAAGQPCKADADKTDVNGGRVRWSWGCATAKATVHSEGVLHYHGETVDGEYTLRTSLSGHPPFEKSQSFTGRYLGPCDVK
jgi:Protein of unknown function (DUF3617)